jgi:hypothetical protein
MCRAFIVGLATLVAALAVGCGGSSDSSKQVDAISKTYNTYIAAVKNGNGKLACEQLTAAYRGRVSQLVTPRAQAKLKGVSCQQAIDQGTLRAVLQKFEPNLTQIEVNGNRASGVDPGEGPFGPQKVLLRRLGGDWKIAGTNAASGRLAS